VLRTAGRPAVAQQPGPGRPPGAARWLRWVLLAVLAVGVAVCVVILAAGLPTGRAAVRAAAGSAGLVRVLPSGDRVLSGPSLAEVNSLADGMGTLWVTGGNAGQNHLLYAVNPATSRIYATVTLPSRQVINPGDVAAGPGAVWVAIGASLYKVVPGLSGRTVIQPFATLPHGGLIGDVVTAAGAVWVDDTTRGAVYRYAAATGRLDAAVTIGATAGVMAVGDGGVWVADPDARMVSRISVARNRIDAVVTVPAAPTHLATSGGTLWATGGTDSVMVVGAGGRVRTVPVAGEPTGLAAAGGTVWVASTGSGTLARIDARRDAVVATVPVGERPYAVAADATGVWVAVLGQPVMDHVGSRVSGTLGWLLRLCGIG
jgi:YVTN family beta-propeller protein